MKTVVDYEALSAAITAHFRPGVDTNCTLKADALRREIAAKRLQLHQWAGGLLLLRERDSHQILNYYRTDRAVDPDLRLPAHTVVEIPLRPGKEAELPWWERQGFRVAERRLRLTRPAFGSAAQTAETCKADAQWAMELLHTCFSPETGCLPAPEELAADIRENRLLAWDDLGLLRFDNGRVAEIRHLAVAPSARGNGIGTALLEQFNRITADRTARVWTGLENQTARRLYEKAGFAADGWQSLVLIKD